MNVEFRIYKRYDTDLLSLHDAGFSISRMMSEAISAYANGQPCYFLLDELVPFDMNDKKSIRLRFKINNKDKNAIALIQNIKRSYRSNFCKQVLRNAMIQQNLVCYFSDFSMISLHENNLKTINLSAIPGLKKCSDYRRIIHQHQILGQTITIQKERGYIIPQTSNIPSLAPSFGTYYTPQQAQNTQTFTQPPIYMPTNEPYVPNTVSQAQQPTHVSPALENAPEIIDNTSNNTKPLTAPEAANNAALMNLFDNI